MSVGLAGALAAAVCYGTGSVLQAVGSRRAGRGATLDLHLFVRIWKELPFVAGLGLDVLAFALSFVALRSLPLFVVQAAVAGSLAVTAVLAVRIVHASLSIREWVAVGGVCLGLALLALSAGPEPARQSPLALHVAVLLVAVVLALAGVGAIRLPSATSLLAALSGLGFGVVATAVHLIGSLAPASLVGDPAAYAVIVAGLVGFVCYTAALQLGSVTAVTGVMVVAETLLPALVGVLVLGDRPRSGLAVVAVFGFVVAVGCALVLSRFGEIDTVGPDSDAVRR